MATPIGGDAFVYWTGDGQAGRQILIPRKNPLARKTNEVAATGNSRFLTNCYLFPAAWQSDGRPNSNRTPSAAKAVRYPVVKDGHPSLPQKPIKTNALIGSRGPFR